MNSCGDFKSQVIRIRSAVNNLISTMRFQTVGPAVPKGGGGWERPLRMHVYGYVHKSCVAV